ncbi:MAG: hypothetical protein LBU70_06720 [Chitinispirillales bacterium]|jgi:hypothetical protein|nr:hypothetical protein [Chitinispirillales bacterium]
MKTNTLPYKVAFRIKRSKADVFIPSDFSDLSGYDQVLRVLRNMVRTRKLIKIGRGIYAKTWVAANGDVRPTKFIGDLARQALEKYGVETGNSSYWNAYNADTSTQIPTGRVIAVSKRVRRKISYNGYSVSFEMMGAKYRK